MRQAQDYTAAVVPEGGEIELNTLRTWVIDPAHTVVGGAAMVGGRTGWVLELMVTPFDDLQRDGEGPEWKQSSLASTLVAGNLIGIYIFMIDRDAGDGLTDMRWYTLDRAWPDLAAYSESFSLFELRQIAGHGRPALTHGRGSNPGFLRPDRLEEGSQGHPHLSRHGCPVRRRRP